MRKERLAIPNIGPYTVALATAVEAIGAIPWWSTSTSKEAMELGKAAAPESLCLPFKAHLGHFIEADNAGVENALMVNSVGTCRLRYYHDTIQRILADMGRDIRIWTLGFDGIKPPIVKYFDPPLWHFLRTSFLAGMKVRAIDTIEIETARTRPREARRGAATRFRSTCLDELAGLRTVWQTIRFRRSIPGRFAAIERDPAIIPLRVGLVGEVSVLRDRLLNCGVEEILGHRGVEIQNFFMLGAEIGNIFHIPTGYRKHSRRHLKRLARSYLKTPVGGHALDSVAHSIASAREGFDGMLHICPSGCIPEISVRPILRRISQDMDIPILPLSFDEHTSAVGVLTRIEAFLDILAARRKRLTPTHAGNKQ